MAVTLANWDDCVAQLQEEYSQSQIEMWIRPLHAEVRDDELVLFAPNHFLRDWVKQRFLPRITELLRQCCDQLPSIKLGLGSTGQEQSTTQAVATNNAVADTVSPSAVPSAAMDKVGVLGAQRSARGNVNANLIFDNFVEGGSNRMARAACLQIAENPGGTYNPLCLCGGVGLGKTHLLHAIGNTVLSNDPKARVLYVHAERFVADMVRALQTNQMNEFKVFYRTVKLLLIDDVQFFAGKKSSQEELFHTINTLLDGQCQVVFTCDRYPKELAGFEERLKSRFSWGLTVTVDPPELETRVAILKAKAQLNQIELPDPVAFFVAKRICSNVRELEGALKRIVASAHFTGKAITLDFVKEALKDLLSLQDKMVTLSNIQKTVAEYYKIRLADLLSKRRSRSIARPRQIAMALAKELTSHSLPEIGDAFGGRDHTTVLHACRTVKSLREKASDIEQDFVNLMRIMTA